MLKLDVWGVHLDSIFIQFFFKINSIQDQFVRQNLGTSKRLEREKRMQPLARMLAQGIIREKGRKGEGEGSLFLCAPRRLAPKEDRELSIRRKQVWESVGKKGTRKGQKKEFKNHKGYEKATVKRGIKLGEKIEKQLQNKFNKTREPPETEGARQSENCTISVCFSSSLSSPKRRLW